MSALKLHELILLWFPHTPPPATFKRGDQSGKTPIDAAWVTDNVSLTSASWCSTDSSPGNHRAIILDINLLDCIGEPCYSVVCPLGRRLNSTLPFTRKKYLQVLQAHANHHKLEQKLVQLFLLASSPATLKPSLLQALESFDRVKSEGMKNAKHCCHHLNMSSLQFSPEINLWRK